LPARLLLAALVVSVVLAGCGGAARRQAIVAKVGDRGISEQDLEGWMAVSAPGHLVPDPPRFTACVAGKSPQSQETLKAQARRECAQEHESLKAGALGFLIRCEWLVAEAERQGIALRAAQIAARVATERAAFERDGATAHDVELQAEAGLAASILRRRLPASASRVTRGQAAAYYRLHRQRFERPERRYFLIAEGLTREEAGRFLREARHGAKVSAASPFFAEEFPRSSIAIAEGEYKALREAIFAAEPDVLSGPATLNGAFTVFEVTRVTPGRLRPFGEVAPSIERLLERRQRGQSLPLGLLSALRERWRGRTNCRPGYVVAQCRQYAGGPVLEEAPEFG